MRSSSAKELEQETEDLYGFGAYVRAMRTANTGPQKISQAKVLSFLPGWTPSMFSRLEDGTNAPRFEHIPMLFHALKESGAKITPSTPYEFVQRARRRASLQQTHKDYHSEAEWSDLLAQLCEMAGFSSWPEGMPGNPSIKPLLAETRHLLDFPEWHESVLELINDFRGKKLLVLHAPAGTGKSSQLNWLATHLYRLEAPSFQIINYDMRSQEAEEALEKFLGIVCTELGHPLPQIPSMSLDDHITLLLEYFKQAPRPIVILLDHCEAIFAAQRLVSSWEQFFLRFLRGQHRVKIVLATRIWYGWFSGEQIFIEEMPVPHFSREQAMQFLKDLGLASVPGPLLHEIYKRTGGIPLCLEWFVTLVKRPALSWEDFDLEDDEEMSVLNKSLSLTLAVQKLLAEPHVFGRSLADTVEPLLERLLSLNSLSVEAQLLLYTLALTPLPLAKPALAVICRSPRSVEELRQSSLLVAYQNRAQLLPMVAAVVAHKMSLQQRQECERFLIDAYMAWLTVGNCTLSEGGNIVYELAVHFLKNGQLLRAAQMLVRYGWLSFNLGLAPRIARLAYEVIGQTDKLQTEENQCGCILLEHFLAPYYGKTKDADRCEREYSDVLSQIHKGTIHVEPATEVHLVHHILINMTAHGQFDEALKLLECSYQRLHWLFVHNLDLQASMLERRAFLLGRWSDAEKRAGNNEKAESLFHQTLQIYQECVEILSRHDGSISPLEKSARQKRRARILNSLGYRLNLIGQSEQALMYIEQSIALKEQGFSEFGALASSYGEEAQALANVGRYNEALQFSDKAIKEVQRLARAGDRSSQEEQWVYLIERARILWQLAQPGEAERLIREAKPNLSLRRRSSYSMIADTILNEITRWRSSTHTDVCQLDWRWIDEFRELVSFPLYDWLKPSGPLTSEEEQQVALFKSQETEEALQQQNVMYAKALEREIASALLEHRNPRWFYPNIPIDTVYLLMTRLRDLRARVQRHEINALVRALYQQSIDEHLTILSLVEATYLGDSARYWEHIRCLYPEPTDEEAKYALSRVRWVLLQGTQLDETRELVQQVQQLMAEQEINLDLTLQPGELEALVGERPLSPQKSVQMVKASTAKRFLEIMLDRRGYTGWQVVVDPTARNHYADSPSRRLTLLPNEQGLIPAQQVLAIDEHEIQDHIRSSVAGDFSRLGILGIGLPNYGPAREGCALYRQRNAAEESGKTFDESAIWVGTFSILLASRVSKHPQEAFYRLYRCLERFFLLYRLIKRPDQDLEVAKQKAHELALARCLRIFRGKPNFDSEGCWTKDIVYQRGLHLIEQAVPEDPAVLTYLDLGKMALEHIPLLRELQILPVSVETTDKVLPEGDLEALLLSLDREQSTDVV